MKVLIIAMLIITSMLAAACSGTKATSATTDPAKPATAAKTGSAASASETVKAIYQNAIKRDCASIPPMLTDDFKKAVGTSKDALDALCDSFTDSGKLTAIDIVSEVAKADSATVKVSQTFKDGTKESKDERMKRSGDKWLMDS